MSCIINNISYNRVNNSDGNNPIMKFTHHIFNTTCEFSYHYLIDVHNAVGHTELMNFIEYELKNKSV